MRKARHDLGEGKHMGTKSREMVGMKVDQLTKLLNQAYASEWLAYYQYWLGAKLIKGPMKDAVSVVLNRHATKELNHAMLVANRIIQLGGTPLLSPKRCSEDNSTKYDVPEDPYVAVLLDQNISAEKNSIAIYKNLMDVTKDKDIVTYYMALKILEQEVEHEEDLQNLREDLDLMVQRGNR
jgi:bacterioferritin